jgi:WD40 repeat protein
MPRIFLSHSSRDTAHAVAVKRWLVEQDPTLADEVFLDLDRDTGIAPGERWKEALRRANQRCEAVICLLSAHWEASRECLAEYRTAETLGKLILCARLEPLEEEGITGEWQRCDLFGSGPTTGIEVEMDGQRETVVFLTEGLQRLHGGLLRAGIGAEHFPWPPPQDPDRAPYRGWEPLQEVDAAVFFGRDGQIVAALDELRRMRTTGVGSLFVVLGPSGAGKSSFLRAGLLPRLRRDDRQFLVSGIVRPERNVLTGNRGFASSIHALLTRLGTTPPTLGEVKAACTTGDAARLQGWLDLARRAARARLVDVAEDAPEPTVVFPLDQAEELFSADAGPEAPTFLTLIAQLAQTEGTTTPALVVAGTIRADFYEAFQTAPELAGLKSMVFDDLKPMAPARFTEVIRGPAARATAAGLPLTVEPALVDRLLEDSSQGADTLPLLALTLARLYRDYGSDGRLTLAEYQDLGGMPHVVQHEIDALLSRDPDVWQQQLELLRAAFIPWLATINPDTDQPVRRIARLADLPAESLPLIEAMVARRLLVRDQRGGEAVVEVALESLLRQWDELAGWLDTEREDLKEADGLERATTAWELNDRNEAWLLEGARLAGAEALTAKPGFRDRLHPIRDFLVASRQREDDRAAAERRRQEAELQAAKESQEAAEALAAAESQAKDEAQHHATVLRKRSRVLMMVLTATVLIAVLAVAGFVQASLARSEADDRAREATALRLVSEAESMLAGVRPGGDVRAFQQLLAARDLTPTAGEETAVASAVITQRELQKILMTGSPALAVAFSPDGQEIVSSGQDGTVRLWDAATGQAVGGPMTGHQSPVFSVAFSPDGRRIVSGGHDGTVRLWDAATGRAVGKPMTGHEDGAWRVAFSPDGRRIVSCGIDGTVRLWDAATGRAAGEMTGHEGGVSSVAFSPDGRRIVSGGHDGTVRLWDAATGQAVGEPMTGHEGWVSSVAFSQDSRRIVSGGGNDSTVRLWDTATGQAVGEPMTGHERQVWSVAFSPDGRRIVSGGQDGTVRLWDAATGQAVGEPIAGHQGTVWSVAFSPDGRRVVSGGFDDTVRLWDAATGPPMTGHEDVVTSVAFSPDGRRIVSGGGDGTVRLWDPATGQAAGEPMTSQAGWVSSVAFSPDGRRIVSAGGADGTVQLWDAATGQAAGEPMTHEDGVWRVAFSPDGRWIVSGGQDGTVRLWDAATGQAVGKPMTGHEAGEFGGVTSVGFSPDGRRIVSGGLDGTVRLWDAATGQAVGEPITGHEGDVTSVAFSPDGQRIVSSGSDRTLRLWDAATGRAVGEPMTGHEDVVTSVAFSPHGQRIASGGGDGTVRLWDAATGQAVGEPMTGHQDTVNSVAFSPDGQKIVSGSDDHTLRFWPSPTSWAEALCAKLTHNLSHQQWDDLVSPDIDYKEACPGLPIPSDAVARSSTNSETAPVEGVSPKPRSSTGIESWPQARSG